MFRLKALDTARQVQENIFEPSLLFCSSGNRTYREAGCNVHKSGCDHTRFEHKETNIVDEFETQVWILPSPLTNSHLAAAARVASINTSCLSLPRQLWGWNVLDLSGHWLLLCESSLLVSAMSDASGSLSHLFTWVVWSLMLRSILCLVTPSYSLTLKSERCHQPIFFQANREERGQMDSKMSGYIPSWRGEGPRSPHPSWWPTDTGWLLERKSRSL